MSSKQIQPTTQVTSVAENSSIRLLTRGEVLELIGVSYPALWSWIRDGRFPPGRSIGFGRKGHIAWIESEVMDWIASRPPRLPKGSKQNAA